MSERQDSTSLEHGFFAVMGGFQISVSCEYEWALEGPERMLTPEDIEFFAKHGLLLAVGATQLKGWGKADQFAKHWSVRKPFGWLSKQLHGFTSHSFRVERIGTCSLCRCHVCCVVEETSERE
jgi:hypothetical protein